MLIVSYLKINFVKIFNYAKILRTTFPTLYHQTTKKKLIILKKNFFHLFGTKKDKIRFIQLGWQNGNIKLC